MALRIWLLLKACRLRTEQQCRVLDYGCGPGSYSIAAAEIVGASGKVYALDIHPLAAQQVRKKASKKGLKNIQTIRSDSTTGLANNSVDVVLLYYVFHDLDNPERVLKEIHRVLKPNGLLSFADFRANISKIFDTGLFTLVSKNKKTYSFEKAA